MFGSTKKLRSTVAWAYLASDHGYRPWVQGLWEWGWATEEVFVLRGGPATEAEAEVGCLAGSCGTSGGALGLHVGGATATCVESCFGLGFGGTATPEHEYFFCRPPPFPEALHPWPLARNSYATAERGSFVLPNTEHTRRYDEPDKLPSVAVVLARRRRKGESYVCDRGEVVCNVDACGSCCEARGLSFTMNAFHPSYSGVRIEGINVWPLIGLKYRWEASDWLTYHQKRLKAKHNGHLLVYPGHYPSKPGTIFF